MALRVLTVFSILIWQLYSPVSANDDQIPIGAGDTIVVDVYNERDLFVRARVTPSGIIRVPLIGDIQVLGKTPKVLAGELELAFLDGYLVAPSVSVSFEAFRPFYIRGAVKASGSYDYELELTVEKAIAIAGGLKDRASADKWYIIRAKNAERLKVTADIRVMPGDIIEIEESLF